MNFPGGNQILCGRVLFAESFFLRFSGGAVILLILQNGRSFADGRLTSQHLGSCAAHILTGLMGYFKYPVNPVKHLKSSFASS